MNLEDNDDFIAHLTSDRPLEVLIRGHLWVEAELIGILEDIIPFPSLIDLGRFTFPQKVSLVAAHGFIRPDDVPAYLKLNALRNKVAHNLAAEPDESYVTELFTSLGSNLRRIINGLADDDSFHAQWEQWIWRLRFAVLGLCISLGTERTRLVEYRRQVQQTNERLRASARHLLNVADRRARPADPPKQGRVEPDSQVLTHESALNVTIILYLKIRPKCGMNYQSTLPTFSFRESSC